MALRIPKNLELKLLVEHGSSQVLYAEAGKDFVDFLFSLLGLPLGLAARLLSDDHQIAGCLPALCASYHSLDDAYFFHSGAGSSSQSIPAANVFYRCSGVDTSCYFFDNYNACYGNYGHVTNECGAICPACKKEMTTEMRFVPGGAGATKVKQGKLPEAGGGYVKGAVTYMVMDNLAVTPMSTISAIDLLNKFQIKKLNSLRGFIVGVGKREALELLMASLQSKTVLTDVFLKKDDEKRCHHQSKRCKQLYKRLYS